MNNKMNKNSYKIERWDGVLFGKSTDIVPIIYIKPDETLLKFAKENLDALLVQISGTSSIFDGKKVSGVFRKSSEIPNCRLGYFEATGYYVIVLNAEWHGYPDCLGECEIFGLIGDIPAETIEEVELKHIPPSTYQTENYDKPMEYKAEKCGMNLGSVAVVSGGVIVILLAVLIITQK